MVRIEVEGLTKRYGFGSTPPSLDNVSFEYEGTGAIGYLGPNGAGKTTTLKLLTGLLRPTAGSARIDGIDVRDHPKRAMANVGAVIETPVPYPTLTVTEAIEMVSQFRGGPDPTLAQEIAYLNDRLDLPPLGERTGRLSKGQRQRVVIAASLIRNPTAIILDEPTTGLDPKERILIRNLLIDLKKDHLILMSSHLMQEVTEVCDQVIFINQGKLLLRDTVENVSARFRSRAVDVEFADPLPADRLSPLGSLVQSVTPLSDRRYRLAFDGLVTTRARILSQCVGIAPVIDYESASLALEDAYLSLMQGTSSNDVPSPPLRN
jgi:ABC-2 type transport system ATP-binding protein